MHYTKIRHLALADVCDICVCIGLRMCMLLVLHPHDISIDWQQIHSNGSIEFPIKRDVVANVL